MTYIRTQEWKEKQRQSHLGKHPSLETREKMSKSHIGNTIMVGRHHSEEYKLKMSIARRGNGNAFYGKHHTEESKLKNMEAHLGKVMSQETKDKIGKASKGRGLGTHHSEETRRKISVAITGRHLSDSHKNKLHEIKIGNKLNPNAKAKHLDKVNTKEYKQLMSKIKKDWWASLPEYKKKEIMLKTKITRATPEIRNKRSILSKNIWGNPNIREKIIRRTMESQHARPNLVESRLQKLLFENYPEYKYTGDGSVVIGSHCPDFTNTKDWIKAVILLHGIYWHLGIKLKKNPLLTKEDVESVDIAHYKKYGFETLIIWEDELVDLDSVLHKIEEFNKSLLGD